MSRSTQAGKPKKRKARKSNAGPISFFISLFIVALGTIQLVSTFHTYALNLSELNGLKREQAELEERKQDLENEIARWDDEAYVTAQARERLGFVFPGEQAVKVEHPEAVTGETEDDTDSDDSDDSNTQTLPWYEELEYSFEQADQRDTSDDADSDSDDSGSDDTSSDDADASDSGTGDSDADDQSSDNTDDETTGEDQ